MEFCFLYMKLQAEHYLQITINTINDARNSTMTKTRTIPVQFIVLVETTTESVEVNTIPHHPNDPQPLLLSFKAEHWTRYCTFRFGTSNTTEAS